MNAKDALNLAAQFENVPLAEVDIEGGEVIVRTNQNSKVKLPAGVTMEQELWGAGDDTFVRMRFK